MRAASTMIGCCVSIVLSSLAWSSISASQADKPTHVAGMDIVRLDPSLDAVIAPGTQIGESPQASTLLRVQCGARAISGFPTSLGTRCYPCRRMEQCKC